MVKGTPHMHHMEFIDAGYRVLSLYRVDSKGNCECGRPDCEIKFKHPRVSGWQYTPSWDDDQLDAMHLMGQFDTGYGVLMGSDLVVIDVDARNGGIESYGRFVKDYPSVSSCGFIVQTGSGGGSRHLYFKAPKGVSLQRHLKEYPGLDFQSGNCFVVGPGSLHKSGNRYEIVHGSVDDIFELPEDIASALEKPEFVRTEYNGGHVDVSNEIMESILGSIPPADDYETWIKVGMAIHHSMNGDGVELWDRWSSRSANYEPSLTHTKWASFGRASQPVTLGTLVHMAEQNGWKWPVTFFDQEDSVLLETPTTGTVDLTRPPGFVGEVADWIESQGRYKRRKIAVAAAIMVVGTIGGLRFIDEYAETTSDLIMFCVAGSATGKEAMNQAVLAIFREVRFSAAVHGDFKSEAEVYRNLTEHQAAIYVVDELGYMLKKVTNAQKRGGATYLENLISTIMKVSTKANDYIAANGDQKRELRENVQKSIAAVNKKMDELGETPELKREYDRLCSRLDEVDYGFKHPFMPIIGFTTPETFEDVVNREQADSGFIGRSIVVREMDNNPRGKRGFKRAPMTIGMKNKLNSIAHGDSFDMTNRRVEHYGERIQVPSTPEAIRELERIEKEIEDIASVVQDTTRMEAVVRRGTGLVAKVSFILAIPSGLRTLEHVIWAYEYVKMDLETKQNMVVSQDDGGKGATALIARLQTILDKETGIGFGQICGRMKAHKPEDIRKALEKIGARSEKSVHKFNKKEIEKWYLP